jgi:hypothetical protein
MHEQAGFGDDQGSGGDMGVILGTPYPNPISSMAALDFVTVQPGPVRLQILDIAGRNVMTLAEGYMDPGQHSVTIDGSGLATGMYFVRLSSEGESRTVRVLLVH